MARIAPVRSHLWPSSCSTLFPSDLHVTYAHDGTLMRAFLSAYILSRDKLQTGCTMQCFVTHKCDVTATPNSRFLICSNQKWFRFDAGAAFFNFYLVLSYGADAPLSTGSLGNTWSDSSWLLRVAWANNDANPVSKFDLESHLPTSRWLVHRFPLIFRTFLPHRRPSARSL